MERTKGTPDEPAKPTAVSQPKNTSNRAAPSSDYSKLKVPELKELVKQRHIVKTGLKRKQHFIDALTAADAEQTSGDPAEAAPGQRGDAKVSELTETPSPTKSNAPRKRKRPTSESEEDDYEQDDDAQDPPAASRVQRKRQQISTLRETSLQDSESTPEQGDSASTRQRPATSPAIPASPSIAPKKKPEISLEISIDYGTWKWASAYVFSEDGKRIGQPQPLVIGGCSVEVRSMATWIDGKFVHGLELEKLGNKDLNVSDKIIDFYKLALYPGPKTAAHEARVRGILAELPGNKTLDCLLVEDLRAIFHDIKSAIKDSTWKVQFQRDGGDEFQEIFDLRTSVRLTIPQMWPIRARRRMQSAANKAGLRLVVLAYEPQCALAYVMHQEAQKKVAPERQLRKGDSVLKADLGSGTADFVMYELEDDLGISGRMKPVCDARGDVSASSMVDSELYETLLEREGRDWYVKATKTLGVTERDFERRALEAIERMKSRDKPDDICEYETIRGIGAAGIQIRLDRAEILKAVDKVLKLITKQLDKFVQTWKPTVTAVTGGFSKNKHLMEHLDSRYSPQGIKVITPNNGKLGHVFPVAMGALTRYAIIEPQKLPTKYDYGMLINEVYDPEKHPDGCTDKGHPELDDAIDFDVVKKDAADPEGEVVEDRIRNLIVKGEPVENCYLLFSLNFEKPIINQRFVYMEKAFKEHAPAYAYNKMTDSREFRKGIHEWAGVKIPVSRTQLEKHGFEPTTLVDGRREWQIGARVEFEYSGDEFEISFNVLTPAAQALAVDNVKQAENEDAVAFRVQQNVWDSKHSEFLE